MPPFSALPGYSRIRVVTSFDALATTPFDGDVNAVCWPRDLAGDFDEVVRSVAVGDGITSLDEASLRALRVGPAGAAAVDVLLDDLQRIGARGQNPSLECVGEYVRDEAGAAVPTDVYSFHVDSAPVPAETWLCSYTAPASEGLRNDEAQRRVDVAATRARLLAAFGGDDDDAFAAWLHEHRYDLHYAPRPTAKPFSFGIGNLWRLAVQHPTSLVPACIHRAPATAPGQARLLLIS